MSPFLGAIRISNRREKVNHARYYQCHPHPQSQCSECSSKLQTGFARRVPEFAHTGVARLGSVRGSSTRLPITGLMRSSTACINLSCGIAEKQLAISVSTTHRRPRQASSTRTCRASCAERFGRNPKLHGRKSASKTGSSTIFIAAPHDAVTNRSDRPRPVFAAARLGDQHPPRRQRPPAFLPQFVGQLTEQPGNPVLLNLGRGGLVDARCAVVGTHRHPRSPGRPRGRPCPATRETVDSGRPWPPGTARAVAL